MSVPALHFLGASIKRVFILLSEPWTKRKTENLYKAITSGLDNDVVAVAEETFHGTRRPEPVQGVHHEKRIAKPAVAIIPIPGRARRFRNGRRHGGDDRAAFLETAELQRDRGDRKSVV